MCKNTESTVILGEKTAKFTTVNDDSIERRSFSVEGMTCASCVAYIERNIGKLKGFVSTDAKELAGNEKILVTISSQ